MKLHQPFRTSRARRSRPNARPLAFDALEGRAVPTASLTLTLASHVIAGNTGAAATTATVTRAGTDTGLPLTVSLTSSNPASITVPATATIPVGLASATFNVVAPVAGTPVGSQTVTVSAAATGEAPLARDASFATSQGFSTDAVAVQAGGKVVVAGNY